MPLLAEVMMLVTIAFLLGLGLGRILFGRRPRTNYLND
jgi:hypothetical protein